MVGLKVDLKSTAEVFAIGDIAQRFGLATHVLRHWESMGLLAPSRSSGRRRYTDDDVYRVAAILRAKEAGLSLDQIREMITTTDPAQRADILRAHHKQLLHRIAATQQALELIDGALTCEHDDFTRCPRYRELVADRIGVHAPPHRHDQVAANRNP